MKSFRFLWVTLSFLFLLANWPFWYSYFWCNLGWLQFIIDNVHNVWSDSASYYFDKAIHINKTNQRAYLGAGMVYAFAQDRAKALTFWRQGNVDPHLLNQLGYQMQIRGLPDTALIYFRSADNLDGGVEFGEGYFRAGKMCQLTIADPAALSFSNRQYCQDYFLQNQNNLILDGQFEYPIDWGWTGEFFFKDKLRASVNLDQFMGVPAPSLLLTGFTPDRHFGLYQRISLQPETKVRFSGRFYAENARDLKAWLLYVEWRQEGKVHGTHFFIVESDMEWQYLEGVFTLPGNSDPWIQFYPVLLIGQGAVWSDDIRVEILSE